MSRYYGKTIRPETLELRKELKDKIIKCIKAKWGNITLGKEYKIVFIHGSCNISDDDGDWFILHKNDIGTLFDIKRDE